MRVASLLALLLASAVASAEGDPSDAPLMRTSVTGYLDSRLTYSDVPTGRLFPSSDVPSLASVTEGNFQLKLRWGDKALLYVDDSLFYQAGGMFYDAGPDGKRSSVADHAVASLQPMNVISELYGTYDFGDHAVFTIGKKRLVWGPGFAQNPTDILNPPKDPTDPAFQRAGSWLAWLEFPFDTFTLSFVGAAQTLEQSAGAPSALLYYPQYEQDAAKATPAVPTNVDGFPHFATAARLYWLWHDTDINLFYFFTDRFNDAFEHKHRAGASLSHVFGNWEVHFEGLAQTGSARTYANEECLADVGALAACALSDPKSIAARSRLTDSTFTPRVLLGARYTTENNGMLSLEYYFVGDGYTQTEFKDFVQLVKLGRELPGASALLPQLLGQSVDPGSPQKFSFDPLRRHYAFLSWQEPQIDDDFTLGLTLVENLQDLSGVIAPSLAWSVRDWLTLTAAAFVSFPGPDALAVQVDGKSYDEYGLAPTSWSAYFSARAFY